jgi:D-serine deaminase-like pyridoxal phosphate-dependent protein
MNELVTPPGLDTPCLVIDLDRVEANIHRLQADLDAAAVALRPHFKTHKLVPIARMQLEAGAAGITTGTLGEAEVLADAGIDDVFVAYPVWAVGPKAARIRALHERVRLSVGIDSAEGAGSLAAAVHGTARPLDVLVELDAGIRRTGVDGPDEAVRVARAARAAGLLVRGVFTHGGHAYAGPDAAAAAAMDEVRVLTEAAEALAADGIEVETLSAGSTPTRIAAARPGVTEIRAGTYVLNDHQQVVLGSAAGADVAAHVAATVVSRPAPDRAILDAGAKSLTKDRAEYLEGFGFVAAYPQAVLDRVFDYHGRLVARGGSPLPELGAVVMVAPNHVCPVVDLFDKAVMVRGGRIVDRWRIDGRGRSG